MTLPDFDFLSSTNISYLRKKKDNNDYFHHHFYYYTILFYIRGIESLWKNISTKNVLTYPQKSQDFSHAFIKA